MVDQDFVLVCDSPSENIVNQSAIRSTVPVHSRQSSSPEPVKEVSPLVIVFVWCLGCVLCIYVPFPSPIYLSLSSFINCRLASSLGNLYAADSSEGNRKLPYTPSSSHSSSSPPSIVTTPIPPSGWAASVHGYVANGVHGANYHHHEVNNNQYNSSPTGVFSPAGAPQHAAGRLGPGPDKYSPFRPQQEGYSGLSGPSGRYLSRSIPVSVCPTPKNTPTSPSFWYFYTITLILNCHISSLHFCQTRVSSLFVSMLSIYNRSQSKFLSYPCCC